MRLKFPVWPLVFFHDLFIVGLAWFGAFWLRFNLESVPPAEWAQAVTLLPLVVGLQGLVFFFTGLYRGLWLFTSLTDLMRIAYSVVFGALLSLTALFLLTRLEGIPRSIFPLYGVILPIMLGTPRVAYRILKGFAFRNGETRVLVVGAGAAGDLVVRNMLRDNPREYVPVALLDDDVKKHGKDLHGLRVLGKTDLIQHLVKKLRIDLILIAIPTATSAEMSRLFEICSQTQVKYRVLPGFGALLSGPVNMSEMRELSISDLLGRDQYTLDWESIHSGITGKAVLITGGGGSIGSQLARQIVRFDPSSLIILDHSEFNLYQIEKELRQEFPELVLVVRLGTVCDVDLVERIMRTTRPKIVFHAAAYKHVPMLQDQVRGAALNNIIGTKVMAEAADRYECETFALISTDKAVRPTNVMGASKRVAEIFCQNFDRKSKTKFITLRFGNVLNSAGSVVPLFREQIEKGGPVTVTHPEIKRYFMTIPEACQLILQAVTLGEGGEIFVLDMGQPVKISDLAENMIRLSGKVPHQDIKIVYTGLRSGEKLYEELFYEKEKIAETGHAKILLAQYFRVEWEFLDKNMAGIATACGSFDEERLLGHMRVLVPDFKEMEKNPEPGVPETSVQGFAK